MADEKGSDEKAPVRQNDDVSAEFIEIRDLVAVTGAEFPDDFDGGEIEMNAAQFTKLRMANGLVKMVSGNTEASHSDYQLNRAGVKRTIRYDPEEGKVTFLGFGKAA